MQSTHSHETVTCPACKFEFDVSEAIESRVRAELDSELAARRQQLVEESRTLAQRESELAKREASIDDAVKSRLQQERQSILADAKSKARHELEVELHDRAQEIAEVREKLKAAQAVELSLRQSERALKEQAETLELEIARRVNAEREDVRKKVRAEADETHRLKEAEKDEQIAGLRRKIDELKQKAEQGSVQLQGEVLEMDVENILRNSFPVDAIAEVAKGANGADISQSICAQIGLSHGTILWETKRTKNWSSNWIQKLRDDQRSANAAAAVIVSEVLPPEINTIGCIDGIWVCSRSCVVGLAAALRSGIIEVAKTRAASEGRSEKVHLVYSYLSSPEFQNRVAGIVESFLFLQDDLISEKRAMNRRWGAREKQLERALISATGLCGDLEGIIGGSALQLKCIEQLRLEVAEADAEASSPAVSSM